MANNTASNARVQTYNDRQEKNVNDAIAAQFQSGYNYLGLSQAFASDRSSLHGFKELFARLASSAWAEAVALSAYQNQRGGRVQLRDIPAPKDQSESAAQNPLQAIQEAVQNERRTVELLNQVAAGAYESKEYALADFINNILSRQTRLLKDVSDINRIVERVRDDRAGLDAIDRELRQYNGNPRFSNRVQSEGRLASNNLNNFAISAPNYQPALPVLIPTTARDAAIFQIIENIRLDWAQ